MRFGRSLFAKIEPVSLAFSAYDNVAVSNGAPLVISHGLFGSKSNWNSLCKAYQRKTKRRVIAVDARNHGDSPHSPFHSYGHLVEDLRQTLGQMGVEKVALLGHSMGGRAVMLFALKYPQIVEKLIVADISPVTTSPQLNTMHKLFGILQSLQLPKDVNLSTARGLTDTLLSQSIADKGLRSFLLTNLIQRIDGSYTWRVNLPVLMQNFDEIARFPLVQKMTFDGPTLFIGGANSDYIPKSDEIEIVKLFSKAQVKYIEGAGHWVHSEKPNEFLELTTNFLNEK